MSRHFGNKTVTGLGGWGLVSGTLLTHATDTAHNFTYYANYSDGEERAVPMSVVGDRVWREGDCSNEVSG